MKKKKGGKGLSVLSGRELYQYKQDLFKDQEDDYDGAGESGLDSVDASGVEAVAEKVQKDLFLDEDVDDLDDLDDD
jgi:hypothetical protein